jgi:tRNA threonylcarbamoyladenosine biosynthesis protein TsaE
MRTKKLAICTKTPEETRKAGERLARLCSGVVGLEGDLGAGKTVFAAGMAGALGVEEYITSPTFNIVNVYEKNGRVFNHMDAYRITDPHMLEDIGFDEMIADGDLTAIEWADMVIGGVPVWDAYVKMTNTGPSGKRIIIIEADEQIINNLAKE